MMTRLEEVPLTKLRTELETFDHRRPILRLLAAILYKQGPSVPTIAEWFDVRPATVYAWFDRLETADSIDEAIHDAHRPGRPAKLSADEKETLFELLERPPEAAGYDAETWTPVAVSDLIRNRFDIEYSVRHVRRLLDEADAA